MEALLPAHGSGTAYVGEILRASGPRDRFVRVECTRSRDDAIPNSVMASQAPAKPKYLA